MHHGFILSICGRVGIGRTAVASFKNVSYLRISRMIYRTTRAMIFLSGRLDGTLREFRHSRKAVMEMHYGNTWSQSVFGMDHWHSQCGLTSGAAGRYAHVTSIMPAEFQATDAVSRLRGDDFPFGIPTTMKDAANG
jgi:hypothetical protein